MDFTQLILLQIIAHILADFNFQPETWSSDKDKYGRKSTYFYPHIFIVFILSFLLSFQWRFILASAIITLLHLLFDASKKTIGKLKISRLISLKKYIFFIDQVLHFLVIVVVVFFFQRYFLIKTWFPFMLKTPILYILLGYLICSKPANVFIKVILNINGIKNPDYETDLNNAGKIIGTGERMIALTLILLNQYAAVGLLIAAKSILRFKEGSSAKSEYVLVGTIISFLIAIAISTFLMLIK